MGSFHRIDTSKLQRGPGRIMYSDPNPGATAFPTKIDDVVNLAAGSSQYDPVQVGTPPNQTGWFDLGATTGGCQFGVNNTEDSFEVDQVQGEVGTAPAVWTGSLTTRLAELTLEHLVLVWEGSPIVTDATPPTGTQRSTGFAGATSYTERKMTVLFKKPTGKVMAYCIRRALRSPQEVMLDFQKSGNAQSIPVVWRMLADSTVVDTRAQLGLIYEQA